MSLVLLPPTASLQALLGALATAVRPCVSGGAAEAGFPVASILGRLQYSGHTCSTTTQAQQHTLTSMEAGFAPPAASLEDVGQSLSACCHCHQSLSPARPGQLATQGSYANTISQSHTSHLDLTLAPSVAEEHTHAASLHAASHQYSAACSIDVSATSCHHLSNNRCARQRQRQICNRSQTTYHKGFRYQPFSCEWPRHHHIEPQQLPNPHRQPQRQQCSQSVQHLYLPCAGASVSNSSCSSSSSLQLNLQKQQGRWYSSKSSVQAARPTKPKENSAVAALRHAVPSSIFAFELSEEDARKRFESYQRDNCRWLHAPGLLQQPEASMRPVYLPVWAFDVALDVECKGKIGFGVEGSSEVVWKDMQDWLTVARGVKVSHTDAAAQVYASYAFPRDLLQGAQLPPYVLQDKGRPLTLHEAEALSIPLPSHLQPSPSHLAQAEAARFRNPTTMFSETSNTGTSSFYSHPSASSSAGGSSSSTTAQIQSPDMRQAVAWQLLYRQLVKQQQEAAEKVVKAETKAVKIKDLHVRMTVLSRSARLLYLPAYVADYNFGWRYLSGTKSRIVPIQFKAIVGATKEGGVSASLHYSPVKTWMAAGTAVAATGLAGPLFNLAPEFSTVIAASATVAIAAGMWAQKRPIQERATVINKQAAADSQFFREYDTREQGSAAMAAAAAAHAAEEAGDSVRGQQQFRLHDEYMLWLWMDADWRRWENDEPWFWDPHARQQWAEKLWREQNARRLQRSRFLDKLAAEKLRQDQDASTYARRQRIYGHDAHSQFFDQANSRHAEAGVGGRAGRGADSSEPQGLQKRRRDFLGYYKVLGIDPTDPDVTLEIIKTAFRSKALEMHPDKIQTGDAESQRAATAKFHKLQIAYDVLKDPTKRSKYDKGQLIH